jgi:hypothetical protein
LNGDYSLFGLLDYARMSQQEISQNKWTRGHKAGNAYGDLSIEIGRFYCYSFHLSL